MQLTWQAQQNYGNISKGYAGKIQLFLIHKNICSNEPSNILECLLPSMTKTSIKNDSVDELKIIAQTMFNSWLKDIGINYDINTQNI